MLRPCFMQLLIAAALIPSTLACGGVFCQPLRPVLQRGEAIAFFIEGDEVTMHVQILYEGPAEEFSWVLPVPETPQLSIGTDVMFRGLFDSTRPSFELDIIPELSETCTLDQASPIDCAFFEMADMGGAAEDGPPREALVLEEGSVGPFEFVVLEAADNNPSSVLEWLNENGYDQPEGSAPLLNYYALMDAKFVALRLKSNTPTGEIEPLILQYPMPGGIPEEEVEVQVARRALACVPIQLTQIAATDNMPIQVYVFGPTRAVPLNYLEVELDDTKVDWVGCSNNPTCYDDDYRQRFAQVTDITNHTFITEYAGPTSILNNQIAINLTAQELEDSRDPIDFLQRLANANVPDTRRVTAIIDEYIPYVLPENVPFFCGQFTTAYQGPGNGFGIPTQQCLWNYQPTPDWTWDPKGLAAALEQDVFEAANEAQALLSNYTYLTRLYTRLSPVNMNKDPFFAFKPDLPTVSNVHRATAIPECRADGTPIALDITVAGQINSFRVMATIGCNGWFPTDPIVINPNVSFAAQVASWGFPDDEGVVVMRAEDGTFDEEAVQLAIDFGDSLVMNQTIPEYVVTATDEGEFPVAPPMNETDASENISSTAISKIEIGGKPGQETEENPGIQEMPQPEEDMESIQDDSSTGAGTTTEEEVIVERDGSNGGVTALESSTLSLFSYKLSVGLFVAAGFFV